MATERVTYRGFDLDITFDYYKGFSGSREEPPETESIDIEKVELITHQNRLDITELLEETQLSEIEEKLWEAKRDYDGDQE